VLRENPNFQDANGRFIGTEQYERIVSRGYPGGVPAFERAIGQDAIITKWNNVIREAVYISEGEIEDTFRDRTVKVSIDYAVIPAEDIGLEISDADVRSWYDAHEDLYWRTDTREIRYVRIDRDALGSIEISDEEVRASYDNDLATYTESERRAARHILFRLQPGATEEDKQKLREQAEGVVTRLNNGEDFATLARTMSQDPGTAEQGGDLGLFDRQQMVTEFADAVFGTPVGQLAPVTETQYGVHIIEVTDLKPAGLTPLEEVSDRIRRTLEFRSAEDAKRVKADRLVAQIRSGTPIDQAATAEGLTVESRQVTTDDQLADIGASPEFRRIVFELATGGVSDPVRLATDMAVVVLDRIIDAAVAPFDQVADDARADLLSSRAAAAAEASGHAALDRHKTLEAAINSLDLELVSSGDLAPGDELVDTGGLNAEARDALFAPNNEIGTRSVVQVADGALIFEVTDREPFDAVRFEQEKPTLREELMRTRAELMRKSLLDQLHRSHKVEINEALVARLSG